MSWSKGSMLMSEMIEIIDAEVSNNTVKEKLYDSFIDIFEGFDCDTLNECLGEDASFDKVYTKKYPEEELLDYDDGYDE